jgi:hypothetical protein
MMDLHKVGRGVIELFELVQNRKIWRALVNAVMK